MSRRKTTDRWHDLLTTRFVCQICLTRFFVPYHNCPACHCIGTIYPLDPDVYHLAKNDDDLRALIAAGPLPTHAPQN